MEMEWGTVPAASIAGMAFTLAVSVAVPVILAVLIRKRTGAKISDFFIGCGIFVGFALILEQILHTVVQLTAGAFLQKNIFLYGLYGGLAAALFEETGRLVAMQYFMKKSLDKGNALMYGAGHGGAEAVLTVGLTYVNNLIISLTINSGVLQRSLSAAGMSGNADMQTALYEQLSALWQTPAYVFWLAGVERAAAMGLQICFSVLVYKAVKAGMRRGSIKYFAAAFLIHFGVDFVAVVSSGIGLPVWSVELEIAVIAAAVGAATVRIYKADRAHTMKMQKQKTWQHEITGFEGSTVLFGVNIFDHEWKKTGQRVKVRDPLYKQEYLFPIYTVVIRGEEHEFAAGEFSNSVWGFFTLS